MRTYTTPTITATLTGVDFSELALIRLSIKGKAALITKEFEAGDSAIDANEGTLTCKLTQEETAELDDGDIYIQCRIKYSDGTVQATNKVHSKMMDVLDREVI